MLAAHGEYSRIVLQKGSLVTNAPRMNILSARLCALLQATTIALESKREDESIQTRYVDTVSTRVRLKQVLTKRRKKTATFRFSYDNEQFGDGKAKLVHFEFFD
jgi:hypothetical protein